MSFVRSLGAVALALAVLVTLGAGGCRRRASLRPILITATPWLGNTPLMAARERGLFGETDVRIVELSTDFDGWRALHEKRAAMTTGTLFDSMRAIDQGLDLKVVMALDYSKGADGIVAREGIEDMRALRGKKVAVEQATLTHFVLIRALEKAGVREEDVVLANMAADEALKALDDGRVDAAALWEPMLTQAQKPGRRMLFTSAELPGEIMDVVSVRGEVLRERPDDVDAVLRGSLAALSAFEANRKDEVDTVARLMGMTANDAERSLSQIELVNLAQNEALFDRSAKENMWTACALSARFMESHGMLKNKARAPDEVVEGGPLQRVLGKVR